jgi:GNAT superfamily N-acetyltransferase
MTGGAVFIPFSSLHYDACLRLFDENCPRFFAPNEREDYARFLRTAPAGYRVALHDGDVIAAFGVVDSSSPGRRRLSWILVATRAQGRGAGAAMMQEAVRLAETSGASVLEIAASHLSAGFFARFGARNIRESENGWGPGMHRIDMELRIRRTLFTGPAGWIEVPPLILVSRVDGGHLVVNPPRDVWERSELTRDELSLWSALVASAGRAMIDVLPQLEGGCVNYWDAGNWALHHDAEPRGPKHPKAHRHVHLHLLGRSPRAAHAAWQWGEAPDFPRFANRLTWAATFEPLNADECDAVIARTTELLATRYSG